MNQSPCLRLNKLSGLSWVVVRQKDSSKLFKGWNVPYFTECAGQSMISETCPLSPYPMLLPPFYFHMVELPQNFPNFRDMPQPKPVQSAGTHTATQCTGTYSRTYNWDVCFSKRPNLQVSNHFNFTSTSTCSLRIMLLYSCSLPTQITSACGFV